MQKNLNKFNSQTLSKDFIRHIQHGIALGGENVLALGADFYGGIEIPTQVIPERSFPIFQKKFNHSGCYPHFLSFIEKFFSLDQVDKIAFSNAFNFLSLGDVQK